MQIVPTGCAASPPRRASDPRRGDSYLGLELLHGSESHSAGDLFTDDVVGLDELGRHAEEGGLEVGLIGDDTPWR